MKKIFLLGFIVMIFLVAGAQAQTNLALTGIATQSSTYSSIYGAENAIDGNTDGNPRDPYYDPITHTANIHPHWWQVDLQDTYIIGWIVIWGREDYVIPTEGEPSYFAGCQPDDLVCCDQLCYRMNNFDVSILDEAGQVVWTQHFSDCPRYSITIDLPDNTFGKVVKIENSTADYMSLAEVQVFEGPLVVGIDIMPGSTINPIKLQRWGKLPLAILSGPTFDAPTIVDVNTIEFAGSNSFAIGRSQDVNRDGLLDMVLHFRTKDLNLTLEDTEACLTGATLEGQKFIGCDDVRIIK